MKHFLFVATLLCLVIASVLWLPAPAPAQPSSGQTVLLGNPPGGSGASCNSTKAYLTTTGVIYTCTGSPKTWTSVGSGGGAVTIPQTTTDISTPAAPISGKTSWYTKGGLLCAEDPSSIETCTVASSGTLSPWNPVASAPPVASNWTVVSGTGSGAKADVRNGVMLSGGGANAGDIMYVAAPGASGSAFTMTAHIDAFCNYGSGGGPRWGIIVGDTGSKYTQFEIGKTSSPGSDFPANGIDILHFPGISTAASGTGFTYSPDVWLRILYDGTNLKYRVSPTGTDDSTFFEIFSEAASSPLASNPAKLGVGIYLQSVNATCKAVLDYWKVSQP